MMKIQELLETKLGKTIKEASNAEVYYALLHVVQNMAKDKEVPVKKKKIYYISAEFLIGKLLSNNMINLGIYDDVKKMLAENGKDICEIEEIEPEPSLGNGGLGRLAACFLDSIATLGLSGDGVGLNYHLGLFKQEFKDELQNAVPNPWIEKESWLTKTEVSYPVTFGNLTVNSRMYDIEVTGYNNQSNKLHLFDLESVDDSIVKEGIDFDKEEIEKNLTLFLYPDDSDDAGRLLRIYQQYFMVSNGAQLILDECVARGSNLHDLYEYAVIQINDTHPTMVIPELIRLLVARGIQMDEAIEIVTKTCAYTNHTILAEELEKFLAYKDDDAVIEKLLSVKGDNKKALCDYLKQTQNVELNPESIFDIQIKRLHEYKRQQMNALYVIHKYKEIKAGKKPSTPITVIFGAKAAPAYVIAKDIIHLILCLQELINKDPEVSPYLKVVMIENYNVTKAEKLIPACDISEQISLASKEASGTGNMKFMLNGALTLGTEDGANVEIHELVGDNNIFVFGASSEEVIKHYENADYVSKDFYEKDETIKEAVDFITSKELLAIGHEENLTRLQNELLNKDWFMTLLDFKAYTKKKEEALKAYEDRKTWAKKMIVNIAKAGYFSSDRTIAEYNNDIWHA